MIKEVFFEAELEMKLTGNHREQNPAALVEPMRLFRSDRLSSLQDGNSSLPNSSQDGENVT
jgi:hypothetical protein